jgi:hypothetical protein
MLALARCWVDELILGAKRRVQRGRSLRRSGVEDLRTLADRAATSDRAVLPDHRGLFGSGDLDGSVPSLGR